MKKYTLLFVCLLISLIIVIIACSQISDFLDTQGINQPPPSSGPAVKPPAPPTLGTGVNPPSPPTPGPAAKPPAPPLPGPGGNPPLHLGTDIDQPSETEEPSEEVEVCN